jgi:hypothetical protein
VLFNHFRVFKVFSYQYLSEFKEEFVFISFFKSGIICEACITIGELPEFLSKLEPSLERIGRFVLLTTLLHNSYDSFPDLINMLCELKGRPFSDKFIMSSFCISERVWQQEYIIFVDSEYLSQFFMALHIDDTVGETVDCLIQSSIFDRHVIHDYVNLRLLINLLPNLQNAISCELDRILHVLIHFTFVTNKNDIGNA